MTDAEKALLWAMRNTIDALLMGSGEPPNALEPCRHEQTDPAPDSTLGHPTFQCVRCGASVER